MQPFIIQWLVAPWVSPGPLPRRTVVRNVSSAFVGLNDLVLFHVLRSVTVQRHTWFRYGQGLSLHSPPSGKSLADVQVIVLV